jgi:hypothetical protein
MSEDRMSELGIPRRKFLKGAAATAFVTPAVVSFGLDGIAEAHPGQHFHNQTHQFCANQAFPNQSGAEDDLVNVISLVLVGLTSHELSYGRAHSLSRKALNAALAVAADRCHDLCPKLNALVKEIERLPAGELQTQLLTSAQAAQAAAGCPTT